MRSLALIAVVLGLAGCVANPEPSAPTQSPPPPSEGVKAPGESMPTVPPPDACKAYDHQNLIGKNRSEIPVPTNPAKVRVTCTTCPMTMDYRLDRLNILFDAETGVVKEVKCG